MKPILPKQWLSPAAQAVQELLLKMHECVKDENQAKAWDLSCDILTQVMVASPPDIPQLVKRDG